MRNLTINIGTGLLALGALLAVPTGAVVAGPAKDQHKVYRWVDENGVPHYGDQVPPQDASKDRQILNSQGVAVGEEQGSLTPEKKAAVAREAAKRKREEAARQRDEILLTTYSSVDDIEGLRDRRLELIDAQIGVTKKFLKSLRDKLSKLQQEAKRFRPYSSDPDAKPIDENLARELSDTLNSIILYQQNLADAQDRRANLATKFSADIKRFQELKAQN